MQFNSLEFMGFFPVVLFIYFVIPRKLRTIWLLAASYFFYMNWNAKYALLIGISTVVTYWCGVQLERVNATGGEDSRKKRILVAGLVINLLILAVFKYANFGLDTIDNLEQLLGIGSLGRRLDIMVPVGISFYTFQALGYIIDVYRGDVAAEHNFIRYALFVSFFPQLVAGPIERSKNLLGQINDVENFNLWNAKRVTSGAILMVWGFFMKMVIADRLALLVDNVYDSERAFGSTALIMATLGFTIQIYCDFAAYSIIAIGCAKIMGFTLMENFNTPYFSRSIREFWQRWHISLSTWFKDYLYIPLGGNRKGKRRKIINLMIVFLVSGLWHGASWTYVIWGGLHGLYQVIGDATAGLRDKVKTRLKVNTEAFSYGAGKTVVTFLLVSFAWIFFRADTIEQACRIIRRIVTRPDPWKLFNGGIYEYGLDRPEMNILMGALLVLLLVDLVRYFRKQTIDAFLMEQNLWFEWLVIIGLIMAVFVFGEYGPGYDAQEFIYFQF